jgi:hypothetical protein
MSSETTPPSEHAHFVPHPPAWVEPDIDQVGTLAAMKYVLEYARRAAHYLSQVEVAAYSGPAAENDATILLARHGFSHTIEVILDRWRRWFPDDPPPNLPEHVRHGTRAFRVVDEVQRGLVEQERRYDAIIKEAREMAELAREMSRSPGPAAEAKNRLQIEDGKVLLDGKQVPLGLTTEASDAALCFLHHLIEAHGDWISGPEITKAEAMKPGQGLAGQRWDRVKNKLPVPIRTLICSDRRKGYRIAPEGLA